MLYGDDPFGYAQDDIMELCWYNDISGEVEGGGYQCNLILGAVIIHREREVYAADAEQIVTVFLGNPDTDEVAQEVLVVMVQAVAAAQAAQEQTR